MREYSVSKIKKLTIFSVLYTLIELFAVLTSIVLFFPAPGSQGQHTSEDVFDELTVNPQNVMAAEYAVAYYF